MERGPDKIKTDIISSANRAILGVNYDRWKVKEDFEYYLQYNTRFETINKKEGCVCGQDDWIANWLDQFSPN